MSTLGTPWIWTPWSRLAVLQWQASMEPDFVDDHDQRDIRLLSAVAHIHVDRQRFLERRRL